MNAPIYAQRDTIELKNGGIYVRDDDGTVVKIGRGGIHVYDEYDSIDVRIGNPDLDPYRNVRTRWVLMDLGFDVLIPDEDYRLSNGSDPFELKAGKSTNVNLHLFQQRINLINHAVNLKWGLTFQFHKYSFNNPVTLQKDAPQATFNYFENTNFKKNRLSATYLTMPVMLNFETKPCHKTQSFHINIGAYGGPRLGANFKTKVDGDKDKIRDDYNLAKWRYGLRAEIGYGWFKLYGTLGLNNLFQDSKDNGYKVTPLSVGFIIIPF
jgi:hypothetical protein